MEPHDGMSVEVSFDEADGIAVVRCSHEVTSTLILQGLREIPDSDQYPTISGAVWDYRFADLSSLTLDTMKTVWAALAKEPIRPDLRVASVFSGAEDGLILHLWQSAASGRISMERRHFTDMAAARRWVSTGVEPEQPGGQRGPSR